MAGLFDRRLLVVSGKGGVGKSTVSAAIALAAARAGKRTLLCEVNAKERVTQLLGHAPVGPEVRQLEENLFAVDVRPNEAMREYALMTLKWKTLYNAVFENRFVRYFLRFVPSLQELVMLGKILFHVKEAHAGGRPRWDLVVMDAPATGHAISFLSVPQVIIDTVPPGPMSTEAEWMRAFLTDPSVTAAVLVSLPEEMPVNETIELDASLRKRVFIPIGGVVLNGFISERFSEADEDAAKKASEELGALVHAHRERALVSRASEKKLKTAIAAPLFRVPRLFLPEFSRSAVEQVAESLQPLLTGDTT